MAEVSVSEEAHDIIHGERQAAYGDPRINLRRIAQAWSAVLGYEVTANQVALCMAALKLVRESTGTGGVRDNYVDAIGYIELGWGMTQ